MKNAIILTLGLLMAGELAAATSGVIQARLVITAQCHINGQRVAAGLPEINCGHQGVSQPAVTQQYYTDPQTRLRTRLITVEW